MKTKRTLADFGELWPAETKIRDEIDSGNAVVIGKDVPEADAGRERQVRASFVRYLALGGCDDCKTHEKGLRVRGALVVGDGKGEETNALDLEGCVLTHDLVMFDFHFADKVLLRSCSGKSFNFTGSTFLAGLSADGLEAKGDVFLRGVKAQGEIRLLGAKLGGDLDCDGAELSNASGVALAADRLEAKGSVFLRDVKAQGEIRLLGAKLGGDLSCVGAELSNPSGVALAADGLEAKGTFFLRSKAKIEGEISLHGAEVGALSDDPDCWPTGKESIGIDRFRYGTILYNNAPTDAVARLEWLRKIEHMNGFSPQPYDQLAKVLREMGHRSDARDVLIEKERLQREDRRKRDAHKPYSDLYKPRDWILNQTVRYGYQPLRAGMWLAILWAIGFGSIRNSVYGV